MLELILIILLMLFLLGAIPLRRRWRSPGGLLWAVLLILLILVIVRH